MFDVKNFNLVGLSQSFLVRFWVCFCEKRLGFAKISILRTMLPFKICEVVSIPGVLVGLDRVLDARPVIKLTFLKVIKYPCSY